MKKASPKASRASRAKGYSAGLDRQETSRRAKIKKPANQRGSTPIVFFLIGENSR
jgi:hypothetical protein